MRYLLTSDWHLCDNPQNNYRWSIFDHVTSWIKTGEGGDVPTIYMLGDLTDKKDRHSAALVNRLMNEFARLVDLNASIWVMLGNHDKPLNGVPFWSILDYLRPGADLQSGVSFVTKPHASSRLLLLPYSDNPSQDWANISFKIYDAVFMHQTVTGVISNSGHILEASNMVNFPKGPRIYSGDIHTPQIVTCGRGRVRYVGAPHPVAFGDNYPCRMLEIDENYRITEEIKLPVIQKLMIRIDDVRELREVTTRGGDQAKVICKLSANDIDKWPAMIDEITTWAKRKNVTLFSIEPEIENVTTTDNEDVSELTGNDPDYILRLFADSEGIEDRVFETGVKLLKEAMS